MLKVLLFVVLNFLLFGFLLADTCNGGRGCDIRSLLVTYRDEIGKLQCTEQKLLQTINLLNSTSQNADVRNLVEKRVKQLQKISSAISSLSIETSILDRMCNNTQGDNCEKCFEGYFNYPLCNVSLCFGKYSNQSSVCSTHGLCIKPDTCSCFSNYTGPSCSIPICFGVNASSPNVCSGFGVCTSPDQCQCVQSREGLNCELKTKPTGLFKKLASQMSNGAGYHATSMVAVNTKLYAYGGVRDGWNFANANMYVYDPSFDLWTQKALAPTVNHYHSMVAYGDSIFVFGGCSILGCTGSADLYMYNIMTDTWTKKTSASQGKFSHSTAIVGSKIYIFGGRSSGSIIKSLQSYDISTDSWTTITSTNSGPNERYLANVIGVGTTVYVHGGTHDTNAAVKDMWSYDTVLNTWTMLAEPPIGTIGGFIYQRNNHIYIYGGWVQASTYQSSLIMDYDISNNSWSTITVNGTIETNTLPQGRSNGGFAQIGNAYYILGGSASNYYADLWSFN